MARRMTRLLAMGGVAALLAACEGEGAAAEARGADRCVLFDHSHAAWTRILSRFVRAEKVDYTGLHQRGRPDLEAYLRELSAVCRDAPAHWSRPQRLAYWINTYNASTVKLVVDHHPIKSIRSIGLLPFAAFRERFISRGGAEGERISLDTIENDLLRKQIGDPRIHFALVCASVSCAALRPEAYRAADIDRQLDEAAFAFLADRTKNRIDPDSGAVQLSPVFRWYQSDFEESGRSIAQFAAHYAPADLAAALRRPGARMEFTDYDWSLNGS